MKNMPAIVCLCGSTRFMDAFHEAGWQLTLDGYIVLTVGVCKHAEHHGGEALGEDVAARLDELHLRKIDLAEWVFVLNVGGYIGESTRKEIEYAKGVGKRITYLEPLDGDRADEAERTMPVGPFLDSLNHDAGCGCEWCRFNDGDRADEAHDREGD